jgi:hypothetical protein
LTYLSKQALCAYARNTFPFGLLIAAYLSLAKRFGLRSQRWRTK